MACATTEVENELARLRRQEFHQVRSVLPDKCVLLLVEFGIPFLFQRFRLLIHSSRNCCSRSQNCISFPPAVTPPAACWVLGSSDRCSRKTLFHFSAQACPLAPCASSKAEAQNVFRETR